MVVNCFQKMNANVVGYRAGGSFSFSAALIVLQKQTHKKIR
jgi:hypothetical protein